MADFNVGDYVSIDEDDILLPLGINCKEVCRITHKTIINGRPIYMLEGKFDKWRLNSFRLSAPFRDRVLEENFLSANLSRILYENF